MCTLLGLPYGGSRYYSVSQLSEVRECEAQWGAEHPHCTSHP
jgi:hypothetical protein